MAPYRKSRKGRPHGSHAGTRAKPRSLLTGTLRINDRGTGSVETPEGTFVIPRTRVYEAMGGDTVQVRRLPSQRPGKETAGVVHVLDRAHRAFVGRYVEDGPLRVLVPLDDRLCHDFLAVTESRELAGLGVQSGDFVFARIVAYPTRREAGRAAVERRVGDDESESLAIDAVIASFDLPVEFSQAALDQARALRFDLASALAEPARRDIRDRFMVTIDPDDARDFDDAVSISPIEGGGWLLGVHIADVSAYVETGSAIDRDARLRSTSVYLADRVIPMLPEELSCDLCSLRPGEDRLAVTVDLTLDAGGRVVVADCYPSIVRSKARLRYREADDVLRAFERRDAFGGPWVDGVDLGAFLHELDRVRVLREGLRRDRGAIGFTTSEAKARLDEEGRPVEIEVRRPTPATKLVEEAMLAANEAVARRVLGAGVPGAFRVHEPPDADSLAAACARLKEIDGIGVAGVAGLVTGGPQAIQRMLEAVRAKPSEELVSSLLLRSMKRAVYSASNDGHFGLGSSAYCHFTSPIRRYPDLVMHRALKQAACGGRAGVAGKDASLQMESICAHASKMERIAAAAGYESQAIKIAEYMEGRIGESFSGVVCAVQPFGLFVKLDETCAEGLVHVRDMGGGWWDFDEGRCELAEEGSDRVYRLGQRVAVTVRSCDTFRGRIDCCLAG